MFFTLLNSLNKFIIVLGGTTYVEGSIFRIHIRIQNQWGIYFSDHLS